MLTRYNTAKLRFELYEKVGLQGQNSTVFRAKDLQLDKELAIKRIEKKAFSDIDKYFLEASLVSLSAHPNIAPIYYACEDEDYVYLAMPYYTTGSLKARMQNQFLTNQQIITHSVQILSGLHNIHSKRLIHFDVKPDNILLSEIGEAVLSDFGLARQMSYSGTAGQDRIYGKMTPPEAFKTDEFCRKFDIYQFGLTLYRMVVGEKTFYEEYEKYVNNGKLARDNFRFAVVNGKFPSRDQFLEHTPQSMVQTIRKCLETDLHQRFSSAVEVVNSLSSMDGNLLGWRYSEQGKIRSWYKDGNDRILKLEVLKNGESVAKKQVGSGKEKKITAYCKSSISRREIKSFLRKY